VLFVCATDFGKALNEIIPINKIEAKKYILKKKDYFKRLKFIFFSIIYLLLFITLISMGI